jgi:nitroreductase
MDIIEAIVSRRSIRSFEQREVPNDILEKILNCGLCAPSSKNSNPWFFVVTKGEDKDRIVSWIEEGSSGNNVGVPVNAKTGQMAVGAFNSTAESIQIINEAHVLVLVFNRAPMSGGNEAILNNPQGGRGLYTYAGEMIGIGAAIENILLSAHALGLGAVYMADSFPARKAVQSFLKTSAEMLGSIAIGYPTLTPPPREIHPNLIGSWDEVVTSGIPTDNFTAKEFKINV